MLETIKAAIDNWHVLAGYAVGFTLLILLTWLTVRALNKTEWFKKLFDLDDENKDG